MWCTWTILFALYMVQGVTGESSCNFENGIDSCSYYIDTSQSISWRLGDGVTNTSFTRPVVDNTYQNKTGHYIFIETTFPQSGTGSDRIARFNSPQAVYEDTSYFCLKFAYHMYGPPDQNLHVYVKANGQARPDYSHWNRTGNLDDVWYRHEMNVTAVGGYQIIFEAKQGTKYQGDIALDDIQVTTGFCLTANATASPTPNAPAESPMTDFMCNMDYNTLCGFTHHTRNPFDWKWRGNSPLPNYGPLGDHTSGSGTGYYLFVARNESDQQQEKKTRIVSPLFARNSAHKCLRLRYFMNGPNVGQLNGYTMQDNLTLPLHSTWSANVSNGNIWQVGFMDIEPQQSNYQVVFEVIRGTHFDGCIAIDDINLTDDVCPTVNVTTDFQDGIGSFIQGDQDDMNWIIHSGKTYSYYTGPLSDHTYGNETGKFVYVEASRPAQTGHMARLISPLLLATTEYPRCLTFFYHMFGRDVGTLNIYIINKTESTQHEILWQRSGNRGNRWRAAEVILQSTVNFQVVFETEQGDGYQGDIAIDDVNITADDCPGHHHFHNYSSITCDFEEVEICYYEQEKYDDDDDWEWINSDMSAYWIPTGPEIDHTRGDEIGHYLFVTYANVQGWWWAAKPYQKARIRSPYSSPQKRGSCVEFWYHMYGRDAETLKVFVQREGEDDLPSKPAWEKTGDQGNYWHRATFDISFINERFRIIFEGTTGGTYQDDIAIDDVKFYNSSACPAQVTQPPPPVTLPSSRKNASCTFEDNYICNYTQEIRDHGDWTRRAGSRIKNDVWYYYYWYGQYTGPTRDHTTLTEKGFFMNFDCDWWFYRFDTRIDLSTPYLAPHTEPRCVHFWYYMWGWGVDFLHMYIVPFQYTMSVDPQKSIFGNQGDKWNHGMLNLPPSRDPYRIIFEASKGWVSGCDISIDDVVFKEGVCPEVADTPTPPTSGNCDFESGKDMCGYEQDTKYTVTSWGYHYIKDDFDWTFGTGSTSSDNTGPTKDHTLNSPEGHYMYIESSLPRRPKEMARLISPVIEGSKEPVCIQFFIHMKGSGIGNLKVYWQSGTNDEQLLKTLIGDQGDGWRPQTAELQLDRQFQLVFEASVGRVTYGDIAIDDITILRQPCQGHQKEALCTFDVAGDWCGFVQSTEDDVNWEWYDVNKGDNPLIDYPVDKSYIYVALSSKTDKQQKIAKILTGSIEGRSSQHCLEYDYYLSQNSTTNKLTIAIRTSDGKVVNVVTWATDLENGGWKHEILDLSKEVVGEKYQVVFIGVLEDGNGAIGLDNPTVSLGSCEEISGSGNSARKGNQSGYAISIFFSLLSVILLIIIIVFAAFYLYRKNRDNFPMLSVKYDTHKDDDNMNELKAVEKLPKSYSIDNPVYVSDPSTAVSFDGPAFAASS